MATSYISMLSLLFLIALFSPLSQVLGRVPLGSSLSASDNRPWVSRNGTFAFGFRRMDSDDELQLAIWFAGLPDGDQAVVWSAKRKSPVGRDAKVELDNTGNLMLTYQNSLVWMSNTSGLGVETAEMSDSGNLVLLNSSLKAVWQSFTYPSDTLLPGQRLTTASELTTLASPFSPAYYSLKMLQQPTSLTLALTYNMPQSLSESSPPESYSNYSYWSSPEISNATGDVTARLDDAGNFAIIYGSSTTGAVYVHKNDESGGAVPRGGGNGVALRRIAIESNGNLRLYRWDDGTNGTRGWAAEWAAVSNPCSIAGICGNGICSLDREKSNVSCNCPTGTSADAIGRNGCSANLSSSSNSRLLPGDCTAPSSEFKIVAMQQTKYYISGESIIANYSDNSMGSDCGNTCLSDCKCVASVYGLLEEKTYCWTLGSLLFGGMQDPSSTLFLKVGINSSITSPSGRPSGSRSGEPQAASGGSDNGRRETVLILPIVLCISVIIGFLCFLLYHSVNKKRRALLNALHSHLTVPGAPRNFNYRDLQNATSNFSEMLGTGGFGSVYKGSVGDGTLVAVKKLERALPHGEKEFITEVNTIGSMHHMNLVRLWGFCSEGPHRLLVYEFMSNGSLDKWIFNRGNLLDWKTRFNIALGTAQGIAYFHEQCRNRIIHCDIKPENILLDENFCPKVSDFGLAKLMGREHSHVVTMVRGTRGYLAPEWISNRPITVKADVYSYGMLLLEIIGGRRNVDTSLDAEDFFYPGWAFKEMTNGTPVTVADRRLNGVVEEEELVRAMNAAFWCIQEEIWMRPSMGEVVKMLEGSVEIKEPPMPQTVQELVDEGLDHVYRAMRREFNHLSSFTVTSQPSSQPTCTSNATCSYSTMSPR